MWQRVLRIAQPVFLVVAALAIVLLLRNQWDVLRNYPWRLLPGMLVLSVISLLLTWAVEVEIWRRILAHIGGRLPYIPSVRIWFLSAVLRYIPGNVWQPLSMTVYCTRYGIRPEVTVTSILLYQVIILLAVTPFATLYLWFGASSGRLLDYLSGMSPWLMVLALAPVVAFIVRPNWLIGFLNYLLHRIGREPMHAALNSTHLLLFMLAAALNWLMWGLTFALFTFSIVNIDPMVRHETLIVLVLAYPIAYAIGFISFITPSGFGVREGAMALLLTPYAAGGVVAVAALAMRALTAVGELVLALISAPFERTSVEPDMHEPSSQRLEPAPENEASHCLP